jgi:hypothetical protein
VLETSFFAVLVVDIFGIGPPFVVLSLVMVSFNEAVIFVNISVVDLRAREEGAFLGVDALP